jgi:hypothetical protein
MKHRALGQTIDRTFAESLAIGPVLLPDICTSVMKIHDANGP